MPEETITRIAIQDEDGNEIECDVLGTFEINDWICIALIAADEEDGHTVLMRIEPDPDNEEGIKFAPLTEEEFEAASAVFNVIFNGDAETEAAGSSGDDELPEIIDLDAEDSEVPEEAGAPDGEAETEAEAVDGDDDYCYEDADGNLFYFAEDGSRVYIDEYGEPIRR